LELEANSVKRFRDTVIVTGGVSGNEITNLVILDRTQDGERRVILAGSAELIDVGNEGLSLELEDAFFHSAKEIAWDDYDYAVTDLLQYRVSNEDIIQAAISISPREMSSRDVFISVRERRETLAGRVNSRKGRLAIQAVSLENTLRAGPQAEDWNARASYNTAFRRDYQSLLSIQDDRTLLIHVIELYRKFAVPFGAFCFVFLAVSLGLLAKKSGQTVGFVFGIIIAVIYWCMLFIGQTMGLRVGTPPFWSMWLPNILSLGVGIILAVIRVRK
jgi:lipopolysaccharide export system permease protein